MNVDKSSSQLVTILHAFNAITDKIADNEENLESLVEAIIRLIVSTPYVSYAAILLLDSGQSRFETISSCGPSPTSGDLDSFLDITKVLDCSSFPADKELAFAALADESTWIQLLPAEQSRLAKVRCSRIVLHHRVIGVTCVYGAGFGFDDLESEALSLWSRLTALAIEQSRLYSQIHKRLETTRKELKRSQSRLIRAEKLRSLVEIAMSVAHTIRNPVTAIGGFARRLSKAFPQGDSNRQWSESILVEALRLEAIVQEFERLFLIERISFETKDINLVVKESTDEFLTRHGPNSALTLNCFLSKKPLLCDVDSELLKRCIDHLLANAEEAGGTETLVTVSTAREGSWAGITVTDTGKGMSLQERDHIFDPFYSTKSCSAGIGLTFVHFVITEHSGRVEFTSEEGAGSQFRIRLPLKHSRSR